MYVHSLSIRRACDRCSFCSPHGPWNGHLRECSRCCGFNGWLAMPRTPCFMNCVMMANLQRSHSICWSDLNGQFLILHIWSIVTVSSICGLPDLAAESFHSWMSSEYLFGYFFRCAWYLCCRPSSFLFVGAYMLFGTMPGWLLMVSFCTVID